ncbi:MAG TPA: hypothetical protein VHX38_21205 [Pseudonocardiaceae bacterium]|jgi:hypothetical protein|nr:hypothetical protein [Pseudonocardiaceae bacterium]
MFRKWAFALPLMAVATAAVVVPSVIVSTASAAPADTPPACSASTPSVNDLSTALTNVQSALAPTPDPTKLAPAAGDLFNAVLAVQKDGCLPALPSSASTPAPPSAPPAPPSAPAARALADPVPANCLADGVQLLSAALGAVSAGIAAPPSPTAVTSALTTLAAAVTAVNTDSCLPVALPVPSLPVTPPAP